jgi:CubicO group peptidase (beta-lactamase class C family)
MIQIQPEISAFLSERINAGDFPSAVYLIAKRGEIRFADALGSAVKTDAIKIPAQIETIFDLASLTKPLVTGLLFAKLLERGEINLKDSICKFFDNFHTAEKRFLTALDLATHVSGFPAWKPLYLISDFGVPISELIGREPLVESPRKRVCYSDFNFLLLGALLEKLYGEKLEKIFRTEIAAPLKLKNTFFNPPTERRGKIAACEFGNEYEKQICVEMGYNADNNNAIRNHLIWGEVHDANCYFLGGATGHAGLFSCAAEVFKIAQQFLPAHTIFLKPETCELFRTNFTGNLNEARSLAFQLANTPDSTASKSLAGDSFGHLGFTGTSVWIEPSTESIFILFTNRTHRLLPFVNINSTRRKFHELATAALNGKN